MKIHEYQAKELFRKYHVPTPEGGVSDSVEGVRKTATELGLPVAVKAQIHAGGRGKGGGVQLAGTDEEVSAAADAILGMTLVTKQTGPEGRVVKKVLVEKGDRVTNGQAVIILESMKMETELAAAVDGTVAAVHVQDGQLVGQGDALVDIEPDPEDESE